MFGKVNRSFRTLNDCDMLCSGDAKCWHHVCSLFVTLLAQLAWWTIDRRTRHQGVSLRLGSKFLGLFLEAGKSGEEWVELFLVSSSTSKSSCPPPFVFFGFFLSTFSSTKSITVA